MRIGKFKISRTLSIIIIIIFLSVGYYAFKNIFKNPLEGYEIEKISRGDVIQEVSETGSVRATKEISLGFKTVGKVSKINVSVGDRVEKGEILAELSSGDAYAQLQSAKAALSSANTEYQKLLNGSTTDNIKIYQNAVDSAKNDLDSTYDGSFSLLDDAYTKIYNAYNVVVSLQHSYFFDNDQQGIKVSVGKEDIEKNMESLKNFISEAKKSGAQNTVDSAILNAISSLNSVFNDLEIIRNQCDEGVYYLRIVSTDKDLLNTQKGYINTALSGITTLQQSISSYKIALQKAENQLTLETANPRSEDVDIYKSQIEQAEANVNLYQNQLGDNYIYSPINGTITEVNVKTGETVNYSESIIKLLSNDPFQIKVDIYEQDIVNVEVENLVEVNLVAFPNEVFEGKVLSIDPAETIVDNVVYYQTTIDFSNQPTKIKSGMTADLVIKTANKENVLRISKNAIEEINNKKIVQVVAGGKIENREIVTGLEGSDYYEVISGLSEGEEIIVGTK